ncbi:MAG: transglutaminase-like domain-containing protein [Acidimicrobiales bacterium]
MHRTVSCVMTAELRDTNGAGRVVLAIAPATGPAPVEESLEVTVDGSTVGAGEIADELGGRLHVLDGVSDGRLEVRYQATVAGRIEPAPPAEIDLIRFLRPSRYCESDRLMGFARGEFDHLEGVALLDGVTQWVGQRVAYVSGSSRSTDGAVATLLGGQGVCRDFAHLVIALLRSCDIPARLAAVYAPGLSPMDFHAVAEAYVQGRWVAADATGLAPRSTMLRIATGRDAADTAFLTSMGCSLELLEMEVTATSDGLLPSDDALVAVQLT